MLNMCSLQRWGMSIFRSRRRKSLTAKVTKGIKKYAKYLKIRILLCVLCLSFVFSAVKKNLNMAPILFTSGIGSHDWGFLGINLHVLL